MLTREQELRGARTYVQGGNSGNKVLLKELPFPNFPCREEERGSEISDKPEESLPVCEDRTFQNGRSSPISRPPTVTGLDGEDEHEGCLPSSAHSSRPSTPPLISVGREDMQLSSNAFLLAYQQHTECLQSC